jgi:hypothetical protein
MGRLAHRLRKAAHPDYPGGAGVSSKSFETLRAHAALAGFELMRTSADDGAVQYLVAKWGQVKALGDLNAVTAWLQRAGVALPENLSTGA